MLLIMDIKRHVNIRELLKEKSFFLFGPRATGKTFLIRNQLSDDALLIDLLRTEYFLRLSSSPELLETIISGEKEKQFVVIDEVQKIPALLDEVHRLIEEKNIKFFLTGSSARKLKRGQANMLAGRAWRADLFPLTWKELGSKFDLERYLRFGGLPAVYLGKNPIEELDAYVHNYLYEEILEEGLIRKLPQFSRFLVTSAINNGEMINFAKVSQDAQVSASTIREHYQILEDTLLGFILPPWTKSIKRKAISTAKFYLFDCGVVNAIAGTKHIERNSNLYGKLFEQFIGMEIRAAISYLRTKEQLSYWRSVNKQEVDYIIGDSIAVEVKATKRASLREAKGLIALKEENLIKKYYMVSQDEIERKENDINFIPWEKFLEKLWHSEL
jgi:uncharacterized protein